MAEIQAVESVELENLYVFDVPIHVAVSLIFLWLWMCASVFCYLDKKWSFLDAFYFFYISLTTIGLGDLVPSSPHSLISMFALILLGLSLVSMVINMIQAKMHKTYDVGVIQGPGNATNTVKRSFTQALRSRGSRRLVRLSKKLDLHTRSAQTTISMPNAQVEPSGKHLWPGGDRSLATSVDDVSKMVENPDLLIINEIGETDSDCGDETAFRNCNLESPIVLS